MQRVHNITVNGVRMIPQLPGRHDRIGLFNQPQIILLLLAHSVHRNIDNAADLRPLIFVARGPFDISYIVQIEAWPFFFLEPQLLFRIQNIFVDSEIVL